MRSIPAVLLVASLWIVGASAWGDCPEDPHDLGECDTIYIEPWAGDTILGGSSPYLARVPIFVTSDVAHAWDSIAAFVIPLCYTHTSPGAFCSLSYYWNKSSTLTVDPEVARSVFRHLPSMDDPQVRNRMMDLNSDFMSGWDCIFINLDGTSHLWMDMVPTGSPDQRWAEGSRVLLGTMTFRVEDQMEVCIDTCFWPPHNQLAFAVTEENCKYAYTKIPRPGTGNPDSYRVCFNLGFRCGDATKDGVVDIGDAIFLLNYVFKGGDPPDPLDLGDVNSNGVVDLEDIVYLLNYLFKGGPPPCEP